MQMREVGTTYWVKAWSYNNSKQNMKEVLSESIERQTIFNSQEISHHLWESRQLGPGIRAEDDPEDDIDLAIELRQPERRGSGSLQPPTQLQPIGQTPEYDTPVTEYSEESMVGSSPVSQTASSITHNSTEGSVSTQGARQHPGIFSRIPHHNVRPTQRQSTESSSDGRLYHLLELKSAKRPMKSTNPVSVYLADCRSSLTDFAARAAYLKWTLSSPDCFNHRWLPPPMSHE